MEQQAERICKNRVTIKKGTKACTRKSRNRSKIVRLVIYIVNAFAFISFRSRDLMSCDSASPNRVAEEVYPTP